MNRPSYPRKPAIAIIALAAIFLAGCATHYPYSGGNGVYYGKGYGGYGHKQPYYGHTSYRYDYYRYDYRHNYRPWWYGFGSYYGGHHNRGHDRDRHHDHDTAHRSGDAADELRRVTGQQRRRALLERDEPGRVRRIKQESPPAASPRSSPGSARDQLRQSRPSPSRSSGSRQSSGRGSARVESRREGGIRMPEKRQR